MKMTPRRATLPLALACTTLGACQATKPRIEIVAESDRQWTGVTATDGRIFVNYPRWSDDVPVSVAELTDDGPVPFPDGRWQSWSPGDDPASHFVCVQSVVANNGYLYVLDPANPSFEGVIDGGAKLIRFDLTGERDTTYSVFDFDERAVNPDSYLNDIRIDAERSWAYITDSGSPGIIALDLSNGTAWRTLSDHPSTKAEDTTVVVEGVDFTFPVHADGIALSPDRDWLYYQALTGRTLYRVPTEALRSQDLSDAERGALVERIAEVGPSDGLIMDAEGNLFLSSLELNEVRRLTPEGDIETIAQGDLISWPDTFTIDEKGRLYVTTAQIHLGTKPDEPYRLLRIIGAE